MSVEWNVFTDIAAITAWLDNSPKNGITPEHDDAMRVMKVGEEIGEVLEVIGPIVTANGRAVAAYIGMTGQNPRKGVTHSSADLMAELADVAITALCAIQHFTGNEVITQGLVASKVTSIIDRANIKSA